MTEQRKFPALSSNVRVRNLILKNRMGSSASTPHMLQGREPYPTDRVIAHFANRAKSGAAIVTVNHLTVDTVPFPGRTIDDPPAHFNMFDLNDPSCQNYLCQMLDQIHFYGAKACGYLSADPSIFMDKDILAQVPPPTAQDGPAGRDKKAEDDGPPGLDVDKVDVSLIPTYIDQIVQNAVDLYRLGFDIVCLHSSYRGMPHARFLSPLCNHRTDEYGGSWENRCRFLMQVLRAIRKALPNVVIECAFSVSEPEGGYTVDDTIQFAKMAAEEDLVDILHLRNGDMDCQHPIGFTAPEDHSAPILEETAKVTKAVHEMGLPMLVACSSGFQDPYIMEDAVANEKADFIYMARSWICNPDYGNLVLKGRDDEIVPCIRCNKCHVSNGKDMFRSVCSVNPILGLEDSLDRLVVPPEKKKKVAVVGGGIAGMEFARVCRQRGHEVDLFEASDRLGGLLRHADYPSFKWPLRQFKDFMIAQMDKCGVRVHLNTKVTKEQLVREGYDVAAIAVGSQPIIPKIPGADGESVLTAEEIYGAEDKVGSSAVIIGGGEIGVETGLYLCELGRKVTVLEMAPVLIADAPHAHYRNMVLNYWRHEPLFDSICGAVCTKIMPDGVEYLDRDEKKQILQADSVILAVGTKARIDLAETFMNSAPTTLFLGDCDKAGNVQKCMRSAFSLASTI